MATFTVNINVSYATVYCAPSKLMAGNHLGFTKWKEHFPDICGASNAYSGMLSGLDMMNMMEHYRKILC